MPRTGTNGQDREGNLAYRKQKTATEENMNLDGIKKLLGDHDEQVDSALGKLGELAKQRFAGHDEQIDKLTKKAQNYDFSGGQQQPESGTEQAPPRAEDAPPHAE